MDNPDKTIIGIVGPCKSGKTVLKRNLEKLGYSARHIAQEHSFVPDMWKKISNPDVLIYLEVSFEITLKRSSLSWNESEYQEQIKRLHHAKENADLIIKTDELTPEQITSMVVKMIEKAG
jgi:uridine kinase